jgi:hypothetical protein
VGPEKGEVEVEGGDTPVVVVVEEVPVQLPALALALALDQDRIRGKKCLSPFRQDRSRSSSPAPTHLMSQEDLAAGEVAVEREDLVAEGGEVEEELLAVQVRVRVRDRGTATAMAMHRLSGRLR